MSDEDKEKDKDPEQKDKTEDSADSEEESIEEEVDFVKQMSGLDSDEDDSDGEPVTVETILVRNNPKTEDGDAADSPQKDSPQTEGPSKDDSDSAATDKDGDEPASPQLTLQDMGIGEDALPELDPETGQFSLQGTDIEEGVKVFIYNDKGQPVFGFMLEDGSVVITPEEAADDLAVAPGPKKKKKKKKKKSKKNAKIKASSKTKSESALTGTAERRARAKAKATGKHVSKGKKKSSFFLTFFMMLSTISCLVLIAWIYMFDGKAYVQKYLHPEEEVATPDSKDQMAHFEPRAFSPGDMDVEGEVDAAQAQLTESGWVIAAPKNEPKWALWSSGVIENGVVNGQGLIQLKRKGDDNFHVSFLAGFYKGPKDTPARQGNLALLLNAPKARRKVFFGFGVQLGPAQSVRGQIFLVPYHGSKKGEERRHTPPINLAYNTWYKIDAKAEGRFVNFYFNGQKIDGLQLNADDVTDVALKNIQSRVCYRDFDMQEDGVATTTTTTIQPADANTDAVEQGANTDNTK